MPFEPLKGNYLPSSQLPASIKKKKPKQAFGAVTPAKMQYRAKPPVTKKNTTGNARSGQEYSERITSKGIVHEYGDGTRVLVKKKSAPRKLH